MSQPLTVAISPCPNDIYIFGGWILGRTGAMDDYSVRFLWDDVEALNAMAAGAAADVIKVSAATALRLKKDYHILQAGGAFGQDSGPKLVARPARSSPPRTIAVPGLNTTAFQLLRAAVDTPFTPVPMIYDRIVNAVTSGEVEAGLLIHESALVYARYGLECVLDLGVWWKERSGALPLPLGCIVIDKRLGTTVPARIEDHIQRSLIWAKNQRQQIWPLLKALAQELDDSTLEAHIQAYVNEMSLDMGDVGHQALNLLEDLMRHSSAADAADPGYRSS